MTSGSAGSNANARAKVTAVTILTQRIWTGVIGKVVPNSSAAIMMSASPPLVGSTKRIAFLRLS